jgi:hypothetical protein
VCECLPISSLLIVLDIVTMVSCVITLVLLPARTPRSTTYPTELDSINEATTRGRWM